MVKMKHLDNLLIRGGRIIDPSQGIDAVGEVFISKGKIAWLSVQKAKPLPDNYQVIEARDMVVCPGFIDLHCHLRQPGFEEKETIATGTRAAAKGGFTTVCCMPNTKPPIDKAEVVEYVKNVAAKEGAVRVLVAGCITEGRKGGKLADFGELSASGAVAFSDDGSPVMDSAIMRSALEYSEEFGLSIIDHCEDLAFSQDGVMNEGLAATKLRLKGMPACAEESMVARDIRLARIAGGRLHIAHVSTAGSVDLIRSAKEDGIALTAEVTPHHLTLTEEAVVGYNTNAKVNPPLRTANDIEALITGLRDGVIDAIATDHAPHTAQDKNCDFNTAAFGISGFETALGSLMTLVHQGKLDLVTLISKLTWEPASILRRTDLGTFKSGSVADVVIFDPNKEWVVNPEEFVSKGKNTPLAGAVLKGRLLVAIFGGAVLYGNEALINRKRWTLKEVC